jgi:hypothetical protein
MSNFPSSDDEIDRQLTQFSQSGQVEDELAKIKAESHSASPRTSFQVKWQKFPHRANSL